MDKNRQDTSVGGAKGSIRDEEGGKRSGKKTPEQLRNEARKDIRNEVDDEGIDARSGFMKNNLKPSQIDEKT